MGQLPPRVRTRLREAFSFLIPCRFRRGLFHSRLLHRAHIWMSAFFGTQRCPQRRQVSVGIRTLTILEVYLKVRQLVKQIPSSVTTAHVGATTIL